jgi:glycosyltransferase involved in cell wall biosynthesis
MIKVPKVSVIVPVFNQLVSTMEESLNSLMRQTFDDFECIVVDESTNSELALACKFICDSDGRFHYVHPAQRLGLSSSLNLAISMARGELLARFDSDDVCVPERLAIQVAFLETHPEISVVGGALNIISDDGQVIAHRYYPEDPLKIAQGMQLTTTVAHPTVMFRREAIQQCGGYNSEFRFSEDLDLWLRWLNAGLHFANLPQALVQYRQNNTRRNPGHWQYNLRARISNFSSSFIMLRIIGIVCVAAWVVLPKIVQEKVYRFLILYRRSRGVCQ